jgi:hypothetical protein
MENFWKQSEGSKIQNLVQRKKKKAGSVTGTGFDNKFRVGH